LNTDSTGHESQPATPAVSVVIPCYNSEKTIRDTAGSVLGQTRPDFELIIVDDGSKDGTAAAVQSIDDPRIRYIRQENSGPSVARNTGIEAARGDYIAFLDHDDLWFPGFLEKTTALLDRDPEAVMVVTNQYWQKHPSDNETTLHDCVELDNTRGEIFFMDIIRRNIISTSACVVRRETLLECGGFDPELRVAEDYHLWLKIATLRKKIYVIAEPLGVSRRFVGDSLVKDKILMARYGLMCLDKFSASHGHLLTGDERKAFNRMRRNTRFGLLYRTARMKLRGRKTSK